MSEIEAREAIVRAVRTLQVIVGGLAFGAMFFLNVALFVIPPARVGPGKPITSYVCLAMTALDLVAWVVVPGLLVAKARKQMARGDWSQSPSLQAMFAASGGDETQMLAMVYQTRTIVAAALVEGVIFLNIVAYLVTREAVSLIAAASLLALLLLHFPTCQRLANWLTRQRELIDQLRVSPQ